MAGIRDAFRDINTDPRIFFMDAKRKSSEVEIEESTARALAEITLPIIFRHSVLAGVSKHPASA
jgi:hypothetical protein